MIKFYDTYFENLGITINEVDAVVVVPAAVSFDVMESLIEKSKGTFYVDEMEYTGFTNTLAIQKNYASGIEEFPQVYTIVLRNEHDVTETIAGSEITLEEAMRMREDIETMAQLLPDDIAPNYSWAFKHWSGDGVEYAVDDRVSYNDLLYKCITAHTSQADWAPATAVSLWVRVDDPAIEYPEWRQPTGAHDAYAKGDKVSHNDKHWISDVDANVWEPNVYGWTEVTEESAQ